MLSEETNGTIIEIPDENVVTNNNQGKISRVLSRLRKKCDKKCENELHKAVDSLKIEDIESMDEDKFKRLMNERDEKDLKPFHKAVLKLDDDDCDPKAVTDMITIFLKHGASLSSKFENNGKTHTAIGFILNNLPRPAEYLQELFDKQIYISSGESIKENKCEVTVDFGIFKPDSKKSPIRILVALVQALKNHDKSILQHPLIESFLYLQWNRLRKIYLTVISLYAVFVIVMTWMILRTYKSSPEPKIEWVNIILSTITVLLIILELVLFALIIIHQSFLACLQQPVWLLSLCSKVLLMIIIIVDHSGHINEWPKMTTASAALLAWFEIMVLISHLPECDSIFQMFIIVMTRAVKVFLLFGLFILMGFSLSFWVIFHGTKSFSNFPDTVIRTFVMTNEFDFVDLYKPLEEKPSYLLFRFVFIIFIFFVPIVMMNLILGLIINDVKELQQEGRTRNNTKLIYLIDTITTISYALSKDANQNDSNKIKVLLYPGKSFSKTKIVFPIKYVENIIAKLK